MQVAHLTHLCLDPFIRIKAISGKGKKIGKSITALHFLESHPEFNETFVYPMSPVDLKQATIMFSVYSKGKRNKETLIGKQKIQCNNFL